MAPSLRTPGGGTLSGDQRAYSHSVSSATRAYEPYAGFMRGYQRFVYLRGTLLGIIMLIGLAAIVRSLRRGGVTRLDRWGGPALLPWLTAFGLLLVPVVTADFDLRYVVPSVPVACLAAALAFAKDAQAADTADGLPSAAGLQNTGHTEQQQPLKQLAVGTGPAGRAQCPERAQLQVRQRVHIRISQGHGPGEHRAVGQRTIVPGQLCRHRDRAVVLSEHARREVVAVAEAEISRGDIAVGLGQAHLRVLDEHAQQRPFAVRRPQPVQAAWLSGH